VNPLGTNGTIEERARSYLHSNCSGCHRNGAGQGAQDFRYSLTFRQANLCNQAPSNGTLGITGATLMTPMSPATSLISVRPKSLNAWRMPPLGSAIVDTQGVGVIDAWINSINTCP
jgi:hypothetical protein